MKKLVKIFKDVHVPAIEKYDVFVCTFLVIGIKSVLEITLTVTIRICDTYIHVPDSMLTFDLHSSIVFSKVL